jgi:opacity protein-like surface antigen
MAPPAVLPTLATPTSAMDAPLTVEPLIAEPPPMSLQGSDGLGSRLSDNYLRLEGGFVTTEESDGPDEEIDFDEGYLAGLAFGHRFDNDDDAFSFLLELEGLWTDQDADDDGPLEAVTDVSVLGGFLNAIVDLHLNNAWLIYLGAGIGAAAVDVGEESDALNDFNEEDGPFLAWQGRAGIQWWISRKVALNFGYRFLNIDDVEIDDDIGSASFDLETQQHVLEAGLSFGL